jgi:hypothetical protein
MRPDRRVCRLPAAPDGPSRRVHPWSRHPGVIPEGRPTSLDRVWLVAAFVAVRPPAPPGPAGRRGHCLVAPPLALRRLLLAARSPPAACLPADIAGPRATGPPAAGVPELAPGSGPPVTSLGGALPRAHTACASLRGATISARAGSACDFGGQKEKSAPLQGPCGRFAVRPRVSGGPHWQALDGPLVVELFAVAVSPSGDPRPWSRGRTPRSPGRVLPTLTGLRGRVTGT